MAARWWVLLLFPALLGCGTLFDLFNAPEAQLRLGSDGPHLFGGTRFDWDMVSDSGVWFRDVAFCFALDMPLSLALDMLLLPLTIFRELARLGEPASRRSPGR